MPILATGTWKVRSRQGGFTLLEVMVTVLLIGIISGFAVLSVRGDSESERLTKEAQRLAALLELNRQEALLRGGQRGVHFTETGYSFQTLDGSGEWQALDDTALRTTHQLPEDLLLELEVENRPVIFKEDSSTPQVLLLSSGEITEFSVTFSAEAWDVEDYIVSGDLNGKLTLGTAP